MFTYKSKFGCGQKLILDRDANMVVTITSVNFTSTKPRYEISWFSNGTLQTSWTDEWRLSSAT